MHVGPRSLNHIYPNILRHECTGCMYASLHDTGICVVVFMCSWSQTCKPRLFFFVWHLMPLDVPVIFLHEYYGCFDILQGIHRYVCGVRSTFRYSYIFALYCLNHTFLSTWTHGWTYGSTHIAAERNRLHMSHGDWNTTTIYAWTLEHLKTWVNIRMHACCGQETPLADVIHM
jgi:hypothetical protein